uniref:Retrovirus-related Pol polyprotein from transposon TNT 1-94 n=1 Tax=Tanacetum cinerariifolium TaxID=118510 RepID=A0A6L2LT77_TANCI|nr:retrovirus-related Pol polyprotein from transposon TNT 1-94 [Tanacetum cinerariifolium]
MTSCGSWTFNQLHKSNHSNSLMAYDTICEKETFAPVARLEAIRIFLAYAAYMGCMVYQMDVKSAFLNGKILKEMYVQQPPGFESSEYPNDVCKLDNALYGLKQALRACEMPYASPNNLGLDMSGVSVNETLFRGMIGSLLYLTASRPDIQFSICLCASSIAMSLAEAECVVAAGCCAQFLWIKSQLADYDVIYDKGPNPLAHRNVCVILKEFWYTSEVEEETNTITFLILWWDKPLSFTQDEFISAIGLTICKDAIPLPPKETIKAGLVTLCLFDNDQPTLSSNVLVNSSPLKMKEVNVADTIDKSLSRASVQPVIQSKAKTDLKTKKKKIPPPSKPKSPYKVRFILPNKQVAKTQHAEVIVAITDVTKSLEASELARSKETSLQLLKS